jgi:hypothetical protein
MFTLTFFVLLTILLVAVYVNQNQFSKDKTPIYSLLNMHEILKKKIETLFKTKNAKIVPKSFTLRNRRRVKETNCRFA